MKPVRLHDLNFKSGQVQRLALYKNRGGSKMAKIEYFTKIRPSTGNRFYRAYKEELYRLRAKLLYVTSSVGLNIPFRTMPHLFPASKSGFLQGHGRVNDLGFLFSQSDTKVARVLLEDIRVCQPDQPFQDLLAAASEKMQDLDGEFTAVRQEYIHSLQNFYDEVEHGDFQ